MLTLYLPKGQGGIGSRTLDENNQGKATNTSGLTLTEKLQISKVPCKAIQDVNYRWKTAATSVSSLNFVVARVWLFYRLCALHYLKLNSDCYYNKVFLAVRMILLLLMMIFSTEWCMHKAAGRSKVQNRSQNWRSNQVCTIISFV